MPGFTFNDMYTMPIHLKNFYLREFMSMKKKEKEQMDKSNQKQPTIPRMFKPQK